MFTVIAITILVGLAIALPFGVAYFYFYEKED